MAISRLVKISGVWSPLSTSPRLRAYKCDNDKRCTRTYMYASCTRTCTHTCTRNTHVRGITSVASGTRVRISLSQGEVGTYASEWMHVYVLCVERERREGGRETKRDGRVLVRMKREGTHEVQREREGTNGRTSDISVGRRRQNQSRIKA